MKYILIAYCDGDREITTSIHKTYNEAYEEMVKQYKNCGANTETEEDFMSKCGKDFAWITDGNNHDDYDWKIIEV